MLSIILGALLVATWLALFVVAVSPRIQFWAWWQFSRFMSWSRDRQLRHMAKELDAFIDKVTKK